MTKKPETAEKSEPSALSRLVDAALTHVPFDGWSSATFKAAVADSGIDPAEAKSLAPRGGYDLAIAFHKAGDARLSAMVAEMDLESLRYSDRVTKLVRTRLELVEKDKEAVRRGATLFALPIHAADGAKLVWNTADTIWNALGDTSRDYNWYTKRAILSGVYSSTTLFWLGDQSEGADATWAFLDRRIGDVMQFEKTKAKLKDNKLAQLLMAGPKLMLSPIRAPGAAETGLPVGLPGRRR
ncbi:MAG: COQ9 family protein [Pseudomonadota bacterium]